MHPFPSSSPPSVCCSESAPDESALDYLPLRDSARSAKTHFRHRRKKRLPYYHHHHPHPPPVVPVYHLTYAAPFARPAPLFANDSASPWIPPERKYAQGIIGFHEELEDFFAWIVPTRQEHDVRLGVIDRIRGAVLEVWPDARVEIFGSFRTGLYLPTSDIDLVICGKWPELPLRTIERILLEKNIAKPESLKVLDKAAVPIVKLTDKETNVKVDISFNMNNGLRAAELIKYFKKRFPALSKLIYVLKQFLFQRDLNEVFTGGLSSYALLLLVVNFLQLHPRIDAGKPNVNLGVLLIEFFELYGCEFNFNTTAIRVRDGGSLVPKVEMQKNLSAMGHQPALLCIEDPLDNANDVGRSSYGAIMVVNAFRNAYLQLAELVKPNAHKPKDGKSILSHILSISDDVLDYRRWISTIVPVENHRFTFGEDNHPPLHPAPISAEEVEPKDLSEYGHKEKNGNKKKKSYKEDEDPIRVCSKDNCDCLSNVSTGTSGAGSSIVTTSEEGSTNAISDTDSDELTCSSSPSISPSSAMSISPANSEVGGGGRLKNQLRIMLTNNKLETAFNKQRSSAAAAAAANGGCNGSCSTKKPSYWAKGNTMHHDRADLDFNWRRNETAHHQATQAVNNTVNKEKQTSKKVNNNNNNNNNCDRSSVRADQDTNWRNHPQDYNETARFAKADNWKANGGGKNRKQVVESSHSSSTTPIVKVGDGRSCSPSPIEICCSSSAKERLTDALKTEEQEEQEEDGKQSSGKKSKKKKKKLNKNQESAKSIVGLHPSAVNTNSNRRFSNRSGLCLPNR